jgi:hypothetical protein
MKTIINKTPSDLINTYRNNKPKNGTTSLFLSKDGTETPIFGFHIIENKIYIVKKDSSEISVEISDVIELIT